MTRQFHCHRCNLTFNRKWNWKRHFELVHSSPNTIFQCPFCTTKRKSKADLRQHLRMAHPERKAQVQADSTLIREIRIRNNTDHVIFDTSLHNPSPAVAVRSVIHIPENKKKDGTPKCDSLCSPGFQLPLDLQNLLNNNCQDMVLNAPAMGVVAVPVSSQGGSIQGNVDNRQLLHGTG